MRARIALILSPKSFACFHRPNISPLFGNTTAHIHKPTLHTSSDNMT